MLDLSTLFRTVFSSGDFIPHGHCYLWQPLLVWFHLIADTLIALAYYSIPVSLVYFARRRQDLPFRWVFWLFGAFIVACGTTHLMDVWTLWHPSYWLSGALKALTALLSVATAVMLYWLVPRLILLPSPSQWETALARLQEAQRIARLGHWEYDLRTQSVTWSESLFHLFGVPPITTAPEVALKPCFQPESWAQLEQAVQRAITDGTPYDLELQGQSQSGSMVWLAARGEAVKDATGKIVRLVGTVLDMTERKQIETRLEALNALKDDFLSTVSHELRTPLASLKLATYMLKQTLERCDPPFATVWGDAIAVKVTQYLGILQSECSRELSLVNELLELQRLESGAHTRDWQPLDLADWLPQEVDLYQARATERSQSLHLVLPESLPVVVTDAALLDNIVQELLTNACKYTPPEGTIRVVVALTETTVALVVSNTGPPIPPEALPHLFEKFYRVPGADTWKQGGTGLGLALVKSQVAQLGGTLSVTSDDTATVFCVTLPLEPFTAQDGPLAAPALS